VTAAIEPEPRWHALIAVLAVAGLYLALPPYLTMGPRLVFPLVVGALLVPLMLTHRPGWYRANHTLGLVLSGLLTLAMIVSLGLLVSGLPSQKESGQQLIRSATALWLTNVLVFALWYWRLDAGGPHARDRRRRHTTGAFLFPQMTIRATAADHRSDRAEDDLDDEGDAARWAPQFVDYLFLAFNTSTAFSPTDTPVLTRWGKLLMMVQSIISLAVIALLAGRAVNIL
jgi:hypothetical protein